MAGLVKAKKYDWKDSNLALFGSDTEQQVCKEQHNIKLSGLEIYSDAGEEGCSRDGASVEGSRRECGNADMAHCQVQSNDNKMIMFST